MYHELLYPELEHLTIDSFTSGVLNWGKRVLDHLIEISATRANMDVEYTPYSTYRLT